MDAIRAIDPDTIPVGGTVYAVFYPYDRFLQKCDTYEDAVKQVEESLTNGVPEDSEATVVRITVEEIRNSRIDFPFPEVCPACASTDRFRIFPPCSLDQYDPHEWHGGWTHD